MLSANKICFTCLGTGSKELIDINKMDLDRITYMDKLKSCISIEMLQYEDDVMEICWSCIKQLRISYKFQQTVLLSQETLKKYLNIVEPKCEDIKQDSIPGKVSELLTEVKKELNSKVESANTSDGESSDYFLADLKENDDDLCDDIKTLQCLKCDNEFNSFEFSQHECLINIKSDSTDKDSVPKKSKKRITKRPKKYSKPEVNFSCEHCDLSFNKRWKLQKHVTRVHTQEKRYICTYCNRGFKQSYHLREHITSHTGERNYSCTICDKTFQRLSSQRRHLRSHEAAPGQKTKRTPFLCTVCGRSFPFSNGVQRHMRIHFGIRKHECTICNRKFSQSTHLHVHMRVHTGEKPYICDTCGEAFSLNATLQKHMAVHQTMKVENLSKVILGQDNR